MDSLKWQVNTLPKGNDDNLAIMSVAEAKKARAFHQSFPQYETTPLNATAAVGQILGLGKSFLLKMNHIVSA